MTWDKLKKGSRPRHMPKKTLLFALALLVPTPPLAEAAAFACSGPIPDLEYSDRELVGLDRAVDTEFDAIIRRADPLTNLLRQRDQDWFVGIVTRGFMKKFEDADDPQCLRLEEPAEVNLLIRRCDISTDGRQSAETTCPESPLRYRVPSGCPRAPHWQAAPF